MINQYMGNQLNKIQSEMDKYKDELKELNLQESRYSKEIDELLMNEDVGIEFFSPRNPDASVRTKISDLKKQIEMLRVHKREIKSIMDGLQDEEKKYQDMMLEINEMEEEEQASSIVQNSEENQIMIAASIDELTNLLHRVDKSLNYLKSDHVQCRNELSNMKYYIKTLIAQKMNQNLSK